MLKEDVIYRIHYFEKYVLNIEIPKNLQIKFIKSTI